MYSPVAFFKPRFLAAPGPEFCAIEYRLRLGMLCILIRLTPSSVDESLIMIISNGLLKSCFIKEFRHVLI